MLKTSTADLRASLSSASQLNVASFVAALVFLTFVLVSNLPEAVDSVRTRDAGDFLYLRNAARVIEDDASSLYGSPLRRRDWIQEHGYVLPAIYPYPPAAAILMLPLAKTGELKAYDAWKIASLLSAGLVALLIASAFREWQWRLAIGISFVVWQPLLLNFRAGQGGAFVTLIVVAGFLLFLRNQRSGAAALGILAIKPTAAMPAVLAVFPHSVSIWIRFVATAVAIVFVPFVLLGPRALQNWLEILRGRSFQDLDATHYYNQGLTGVVDVDARIVLLVVGAILLIALLITDRIRARFGVVASTAFALYCGLLLNPHSMLYDWPVAFVGIMLIRRSDLGFISTDLGAGIAAATLFLAGDVTVSMVNEVFFLTRPLTIWALAFATWMTWRAVATGGEPAAVTSGPPQSRRP